MSVVNFHLSEYSLFPYERRLAGMEIARLTAQEPKERERAFLTPAFPQWEQAALRTTYCGLVTAGSGRVVPIQTRLEQSVSTQPPGRQKTRYSSHGLHEYKGKFNPQVVRAIGNIIGLKRGSRVLDPFCGSGTVLVEAIHNGWDADGFDVNPLAIEIAQAKVDVLRFNSDLLRTVVDSLRSRLAPWLTIDSMEALSGKDRLALKRAVGYARGDDELSYLSSWFPSDVLLQMRLLFAEIGRIDSPALRRVLRIIVSDQLRAVSYQDEADLRVRRRKDAIVNGPLIRRFLNALEARSSEVLAAMQVIGESRSVVTANLSDVRDHCRENTRRYDAVISSPPYAMALPYIDTQRLSLVALGLTEPSSLNRLERTLIGSRDISVSERRRIEAGLAERGSQAPTAVTRLCRRLLGALGDDDGFRRRNLPALLYRYCAGMQHLLEAVGPQMTLGGHVAFLVGKNETTIGGKRRVIDTPALLAAIGEAAGYTLVDILLLDAYQRFGLHAANGIRRESLVILKA